MKKPEHRSLGLGPTAILVVAVSLLLASCGAQDQKVVRPTEAVLNSCVTAPFSGALMPLHALEERLIEIGQQVGWEVEGDNYILRSSSKDLLTGDEQMLNFDIRYSETGAGDAGAANCGPGRAAISRIQTNSEVLEGMPVDQFLVATAMASGSEPQTTAVEAQPRSDAVIEQPSAGSVTGTCRVEGLMDGPCQGSYQPGGVVLGSEQAEGCHIELAWTPAGADSKVYSYRNPCMHADTREPVDEDISTGAVTKTGSCWMNENVRVCLDQ